MPEAADFTQLRAFAVDLATTGTLVARKVPPVVAKGAVNIKDQLRREMQASTSFKGVAPAISYELDPSGTEAVIGPETGAPGSLANIAYFGGATGGGTVPDPQGALDAEAPRFEQALADLADL